MAFDASKNKFAPAAGITDASANHTVRSDTLANSATDSKAGLDALGAKLNAVIAALEAAGITVSV